jgi:hypothetical protein
VPLLSIRLFNRECVRPVYLAICSDAGKEKEKVRERKGNGVEGNSAAGAPSAISHRPTVRFKSL